MPIVTVAEVCTFLEKTVTPQITAITNGINEFIELDCEIKFDLLSYEEKLPLRIPNLILKLGNYPLVTLTSLENLAEETITPSIIDYDAGILLLQSNYWDSLGPTDEFTAIYSAGYVTSPPSLKIAAFAIISDRLELGDSSIFKQKLGDRSFERKIGTGASAIPPLAREILDKFKRVD